MNHWKKVFYILGLIPFIHSLSLLAFYFHAGYQLGCLPSYNQPDPKTLSLYSHYSPFIDVSGNLWVFSFFIWLILTIKYLISNWNHIKWTPILLSALAQACAIYLLLSKISEWYAD